MKLRHMKRLMTLGAIVTSAALMLGTGAAQAATLGTSPQFFTPGLNLFRATGSETTYYAMNAIGNLYSQTSIYGCTLLATDMRTCVTTADGTATDVKDDYSRNEFINGEGIGTGNGVKQLCGSVPTGGLPVDFARGSRAPSGAAESCGVGLNYAKDSVVGVDFQFHNQTTVACTTGTCTASQIGPVAAGWRTGDALGGPYTGVPVNNLDNTASTVLGGASLTFEIYCDTAGALKINDWGQLNDATIDATTGKTKGSEGIGTPIGVPIYIPAVNTGSGTYSVWKTYVGCDPNTKNADGQIAQENDAPQLSEIAQTDHNGITGDNLGGDPGNDNIAAANQLAASLYYISYGVAQWRPYTYSSPAAPGLTTISGKLTKINNVSASPAVELSGGIASVRGLYNIWKGGTAPTALRASVAGFLNWVCDTDPLKVNHGIDLTTGKNYSDELTNTISTQFVFPRVPCAVDGLGASIPPLTAANITDFNS